jgi:hypothetical protein
MTFRLKKISIYTEHFLTNGGLSTRRMDIWIVVFSCRHRLRGFGMYVFFCGGPPTQSPLTHVVTFAQLFRKRWAFTLNTTSFDEMVKTFAIHVNVLRALDAFLLGRDNAFSVMVGTYLFAKDRPSTKVDIAFNVCGAIVCSAQR